MYYQRAEIWWGVYWSRPVIPNKCTMLPLWLFGNVNETILHIIQKTGHYVHIPKDN